MKAQDESDLVSWAWTSEETRVKNMVIETNQQNGDTFLYTTVCRSRKYRYCNVRMRRMLIMDL